MSDVAIEHILREFRLVREAVETNTAVVRAFADALNHITDRQLDHEQRLTAIERHIFGSSAANGAGE